MQMMKLVLLLGLLGLGAAQVNSGLSRRKRLSRFVRGHEDNSICWDREGEDGFFSVVDSHNHFKPFGGPSVEVN